MVSKSDIECLDLMIKAGKKVYNFASDDMELLNKFLSVAKLVMSASGELPEEKKIRKYPDWTKDMPDKKGEVKDREDLGYNQCLKEITPIYIKLKLKYEQLLTEGKNAKK